MAGDTMTLQIISPERTVLKDVATEAVVVPTTEGSMGILQNHAPMVATLRVGVLRYKQAGTYRKVAISAGFLELSHNKITILADAAEPGDSVDVLRAQEARKRAEGRLRERSADVDRVRAELALQRAMARLKAAGVVANDRV